MGKTRTSNRLRFGWRSRLSKIACVALAEALKKPRDTIQRSWHRAVFPEAVTVSSQTRGRGVGYCAPPETHTIEPAPELRLPLLILSRAMEEPCSSVLSPRHRLLPGSFAEVADNNNWNALTKMRPTSMVSDSRYTGLRVRFPPSGYRKAYRYRPPPQPEDRLARRSRGLEFRILLSWESRSSRSR